jgi:hypothetical protein
MRKITIENWKAMDKEGNESNENLTHLLNFLISNKRPEDIPRGLDNFRLMGRIDKAFKKSEETGELVFEEADYSFLKGMIEKDIPCIFGKNESILNAVDSFLNSKQE